MGLCARSRGSAFACTRWVCLVSFFTHIGHVAAAHEARTTLSLFLPLSSFSASFSHPLIGTLNDRTTEKTDPRGHPRVDEIHGGRTRVMLQADEFDHDFTIDRSISVVLETIVSREGRESCREARRGRLHPFLPSNRINVSSPSSSRLFPFHFPQFLCFPVSHHGQLIGVIYKGKPGESGNPQSTGEQ